MTKYKLYKYSQYNYLDSFNKAVYRLNYSIQQFANAFSESIEPCMKSIERLYELVKKEIGDRHD